MFKLYNKYFKSKAITKRVIYLIVTCLVIVYLFSLPQQLFNVPYSTVVVDANNNLLGARIASDGQWRFPQRDSIPENYKECLIEFEDKYFYYHLGVNPVSIFRALYQNIKSNRIVSGGSTLTMQTIRISQQKPRTYLQKIKEIILATRLELRYTKDKILSLYASYAPFGGNVVGIDAAAWRYLGHSADDLSWAEAAMLAVLPNSPSQIHLSKSRESLKIKRDKLLYSLYSKNKIDETTYNLAIQEPLPSKPHALPQISLHLVERFKKENAGKYIVSTIDKNLQQNIEAIAQRWGREFNKSNISNLAILVVNLQTNEVMAYCGNINSQKSNSGSNVDIITSKRSTGSILKPFLYYAAIKEGLILQNSLLPDVPININGYAPLNFSNNFNGAVPASEALSRSLNVPFVLLLREYDIAKFYNVLKGAGFSTLNNPPSHYGLSLILGGAEATLWDITQAYTCMGRSLLDLPQYNLKIVKDNDYKKIKIPFTKGATWLTFNSLKEVNRPEEIDWRTIPSMYPIAWKTGTSFGFRDAWAVGVSHNYAVGVWVGNASGEGKPELVGARTAGPVLFDVFNILPSSLKWFDVPIEEFTEAEVCRLSGKIKGRFCDKVDTLLIVPQGVNSETCNFHHAVTLTPDEKFRVYSSQEGEYITKSWFTLPPVWEWYYKQYHPEYKVLPPFKKNNISQTLPMEFIYPAMNAIIKLPKQIDGSLGHFTAELAHSNNNVRIFWHLDNKYLTFTDFIHKIPLQPTQGKHSLTAIDGDGNSVSVTFYVK